MKNIKIKRRTHKRNTKRNRRVNKVLLRIFLLRHKSPIFTQAPIFTRFYFHTSAQSTGVIFVNIIKLKSHIQLFMSEQNAIFVES